MEQIPNSNEVKPISDYDVIKKEFSKFFSNLMESNKSIVNQLQELRESKLGEISESDANIAINDKIIKIMKSYLQIKFNFISQKLKEKLDDIVENYSTTVLDDIFDTLINIWVRKFQKKAKVFFISLEQIYEVFYLFGFRIIPSETLDKLTGALQWDIISPYWFDYNFLRDYFNKLSSKKDISEELKNKTWILVELTRIKKQELDKKLSQYQPKEEFYKI